MKRSIWLYSFFTTVIIFELVSACRKEVPAKLPVITTKAVTLVSDSLVLSGGEITDAGEDSVTARGVCWSTHQNATINDSRTIDSLGSGIFTSHITGLSFNTLYYVRAYATNKAGTAYGNELYITQWMGEPGPQVTDIDGNAYNSVRIGTQIWMKENLKTTHYRDGSAIPNITSDYEWENVNNTGAYCWYNNNVANKDIYGALYNWYTVIDKRNLCPSGWHIPGSNEWKKLRNYLGGGGYYNATAGLKMRDSSLIFWKNYPLPEANNISGFSALPGGYRWYLSADPQFGTIGSTTSWWSSDVVDERFLEGNYWILNMFAWFSSKNNSVKCGSSVRCVKDSIP